MKRIFALLLSLLMVISFAACGKDNTTSDTNNGASNSNVNSETGSQSDDVDVDVDVDLDGYAELVVQGNVDPRVKAEGKSVSYIFYNLETGEEYLLYLHDYNDYKNTIEIKKGYYSTRSAYVIGDLEFKYDVEFVNFMAKDSKVEVKLTVGDPNYKGDITDEKDKNNLPGTIDKDKTNELLEEDGSPTVDWDN